MTTEQFIKAHREDDVAALALKYSRLDGVDTAFALQQIAAWQAARRKLPTWAATEGVVYPAHISMEQCSSEQTARYKQRVAKRLIDELATACSDSSLVDLTGGFGVDFTMLAPLFHRATYVERSQELCAIVEANLPLLGVGNATVEHDDSIHFVETMPKSTIIYLDPARRDSNGKRTYAIADCTPAVVALLPVLMQKSEVLLLKLSPMLDISQAVRDIEAKGVARVAEVHVVAVANECKELLMVITKLSQENDAKPLVGFCTNDEETFVVDDLRALATLRTLRSLTTLTTLSPSTIAGNYLYEPNAAIMKMGCFGEVAQRFGLTQLDNNSHLFVSPDEIDNFPGRKFLIRTATTMQRTALKATLAGIKQANVAVRNFPMTAETLRKRLRLKDGGDVYLFGTTIGEAHVLLLCDKAKRAKRV